MSGTIRPFTSSAEPRYASAFAASSAISSVVTPANSSTGVAVSVSLCVVVVLPGSRVEVVDVVGLVPVVDGLMLVGEGAASNSLGVFAVDVV